MKARHIGKLRKRIANFREFTVSTSFGLFGDFDGGGKWQHKVMADTPRVAVSRYLCWYIRKYKELHENFLYGCVETSAKWGRIMVIDTLGYRYYFQ